MLREKPSQKLYLYFKSTDKHLVWTTFLHFDLKKYKLKYQIVIECKYYPTLKKCLEGNLLS